MHLPVLYWRWTRYRSRVRWLPRWYRVQRVRDVFPEGIVWRVWCGWLLVTVMIDAWPPAGGYPPLPRPLPPPPAPPPRPPS